MNSPLHALIDLIEYRLKRNDDPEKIIDDLVKIEGARRGGSTGSAESFKLAGVRTTCTWGPYGLLSNWCTRARRELAEVKRSLDAIKTKPGQVEAGQ